MKKWLIGIILLFLFINVNGQTYTQSYVDKCTGEVKLVTTTYVNGNAIVSFYNQVKTFTPQEVQSGLVQAWLNTVYAQYSTMACPTSQVVQQTVQNTVSQAASSAASQAVGTRAACARLSPAAPRSRSLEVGWAAIQSVQSSLWCQHCWSASRP